MKKLIIMSSILVSSICFAGARGGFNEQDFTGIVTPDIATAVVRIENFTTDTTGNLLVCTFPNEYDRNNCKAPNGNKEWQHVRSIVPVNKTYVGFKVASGGYGFRLLEVYWK